MRGFLQWSNGVGLRDGAEVGMLGARVGLAVGALVASLGDSDGLAEGEMVGLQLGEALGLVDGASVLHFPSGVPFATHWPASSGAGDVHSRDPRQSLSTQQFWPVAQLCGQF